MSQLFVDNIKNRTGGAIGAPSGAVVTGVVTATSFVGSGEGLTGVASTDNIITSTASTFSDITTRNITGVAATFTGILTYEDVTNIDSVGIITARAGVKVPDSQKIFLGTGDDLQIFHDGSNSIIQDNGTGSLFFKTDEVQIEGVSGENMIVARAGAATTLFHNNNKKLETTSGGVTVTGTLAATAVTGDGSGLTGLSVGITTTAVSPTANTVHILGIGTAQHHTLTLSAGFSTITVAGGSVGESHSVVLIQPSSGICTVGLSTFFQFPSGATPAFSEGSSKVDLISFVVKHVGVGGTQLLTSAGLNYS